MPYNGSGTFTLYSPGNPVVTGTTISSTWANNTLTDLATGLSTALTKDGQTTPTANIPMGGFKLTGLAAGSAAADSVRYGQLGALAFLDSLVDASDAAGLSATLVGGYLDWSVAGNALTVAVKANSGSDPSASEPVAYSVRDATVTNGKLVPRTITSALSITVPDTAVLGTVNSTAFRLWAVIFNDGGTDRLGIINCATIAANAGSGYNITGIYPLAGWGIASSTAVGTGSDSSATFYTDSAVTSKGYTVAGYATWESGLATAGTWSAGPTREQAWAPGVPLPGQPVQHVRAVLGTVATGNTAAVPQDNTIPQNGEGNQLMSTASITPTSAANGIKAHHHGSYANDNGSLTQCVCSFFRDSVANAIASTMEMGFSGSGTNEIDVQVFHLAGATSQTQFKPRIGNSANNTFTINGSSGAQYYGGVCYSFTDLVEVMA